MEKQQYIYIKKKYLRGERRRAKKKNPRLETIDEPKQLAPSVHLQADAIKGAVRTAKHAR